MPQSRRRIQGGTQAMPQPRRRIHGGAQPYGQIRIPDGLVFNVFRGSDGRLYTDHPRVSGPFRNDLRLRNAIGYLFACRDLRLEVADPNRSRQTRRAPSPVVTEDSPPPPPSVELVADVAESASALTLHEADVSSLEELLPSSEESITSSPGTVPHSTPDDPSCFSPFRLEKSMAGAAESASAQTLQEPGVSSSRELLGTTMSNELSTANPTSVLHDTADDSPLSASSAGPPILFRDPPNWYQAFYMRKDREGDFHMYPDLGGPFHSLQEAEAAIDRHLNERRLPEICQVPSEGPLVEWRIKQCLYYPDGTPKRGPNSPARKNPYHQERELLKALLDQYNEYHNLSKDLAHELKDLVTFEWIYEDHKAYFHFNFTTKTNKSDDVNLFFAELSETQTKDAWVVSCCCMIEPNDDGHCCGCRNNGNHRTMHPNNTRAYIGGHLNRYLTFGGDDDSDEEEDEEALIARLTFMFGG